MPGSWSQKGSQGDGTTYYNYRGAVDGKHVAIKKPKNAGSLYYNYKNFHSIILMAVADSSYRFLYVDVSAEGGVGDGGTWFKCSLHDAIDEKRVGFPEDSKLPNDDTPIPFHLVGDDAFALKTWMMKPYSHQSQVPEERIFSYRLSRARRVVENAFGLLQTRLRVFGTTFQQAPALVKTIAMCGCVLHNLILERYPFPQQEVDHEGAEHNLVRGTWRQTTPDKQKPSEIIWPSTTVQKPEQYLGKREWCFPEDD